jgi:uncharacterized protein (TIGR01777 family)
LKLLVAGWSGLIGTALVERLSHDGHSVVRLVRSTGEKGDDEIHWDPSAGILDPDSLARAGPFDGVVDLAGAGIGDRRWSAARKQVILTSRTSATRLLAASLAALDEPPSAFVNASAVGFYGDGGDEELTERSHSGSGFLAAVCRAWEEATVPATDAGIRTVLLRSGIVLTAHGGALARQLPLFRLGVGGRLGRGKQYRSWITLEDEVRVILRCVEDDGLRGPVNATSPSPVTDAAFAHALGDALGRPAVLAVPGFALKAALGPEMATELLLFGQRALPEGLSARGFVFHHAELAGALRWAVDDRR